jgi:hypothetical protein
VRTLLRAIAVLLVLIAAFLIYAVIAAVTSDEGARVGVCIAYVVGAALAVFAASALWRRPAAGAGAA